jgi:hypothetical protein
MPQNSINPGSKNEELSTQNSLQIAEIHDDIVVLKNGGLRGVLEISSVNFDLKSEEEQQSIIYSYQRFLNSIDFPYQMMIRSKKVDIEGYLAKIQKRIPLQSNVIMKEQTKIYLEYMTQLVEKCDIMTKVCYIVVPYDPALSETVNQGVFSQFLSNIGNKDSFEKYIQRRKQFISSSKGLLERVNIMKNAVVSMGLSATRLDTKALIGLYYDVYNPKLSSEQKLNDVKLDKTI